MDALLNIFCYSLIAGLATGIGGLVALIGVPGKKSFGFLMGFTAGVMITLSLTELVNEAWQLSGYLPTIVGFGVGVLFMYMIDTLVPHVYLAERHNIANPKLLTTGVLVAIGIAIHNIPEGIAVGAGYMHTPKLGLFIAVAIALHNIPEGIAVALPLCKGGLCGWKSFRVALCTGLVEPFGALLAAVLLINHTSLVPIALAFAAGVMVFISFDELVPVASEYGQHQYTAAGIAFGAISIFLLSGAFGV